MQLGNSVISITSYPTPRNLRHFPRAPSQGVDHTPLLIIIIVAASVGGIALMILIWRILSRLLRPKSAPLPPRQSLVHERELHLAAFTEFKDGSMPETLVNGSYIHETDETTLDSSNGVKLHPPSPHFISSESRTPTDGSSSSLPSVNDDSSSANTPPTQLSTSTSLTQSSRRPLNRSGTGPRPLSAFSTLSVSSRPGIRAAPHAPHSNVQIVLPTPLGPSPYLETAGDGSLLQRRSLTPSYTYSARDSWRRSLADTWISVGQDCLPDPHPVERQYGHDSMERPARLIRRGSSPGPRPPRSRSNPSSLSRLRPSSGLDQIPGGKYPPVPRVPSGFGTLSGPSPPSTYSHKPRS